MMRISHFVLVLLCGLVLALISGCSLFERTPTETVQGFLKARAEGDSQEALTFIADHYKEDYKTEQSLMRLLNESGLTSISSTQKASVSCTEGADDRFADCEFCCINVRFLIFSEDERLLFELENLEDGWMITSIHTEKKIY